MEKFYLVTIIILCSGAFPAASQNVPSKVSGIFDDLPIDDPESRSVLASSENAEDKIKNNILLKTRLSKNVCYLGEPILVSYELYTALQSKSKISAVPTFPHFISYEQKQDNEEISYKKINKKQFRFYNLLSYQLIPLDTGNWKFEPVMVHNTVSYENASGKSISYEGTVKSDDPYIKVIPLPVADNLLHFSGGIGTFKIAAGVSMDSCRTNEKNSLVIHIEGSGNFSGFMMPSVSWPAEITPESPIETENVSYDVFPPRGTRKFEIPFTIGKDGNHRIPPVLFSYFDPALHSYQSIASEELSVVAIIPDVSEDIKLQSPRSVNKLLISVIAIITASLIAAVAYIRHSRKRGKMIKKALMSEENLTIESTVENETDIYKELEQIAGIEDNRAFVEALKQFLKSKNYASKLILEKCDFLLYAPGDIPDNARKELEQELKDIIL